MFFFYRPKVDKAEAHSPDDVQRMYVVLRPESVPDRAVEEKQAPDSGKEGKKRKTRHGGDEKGQADGGNEGGHGKEVTNEIVQAQISIRLKKLHIAHRLVLCRRLTWRRSRCSG